MKSLLLAFLFFAAAPQNLPAQATVFLVRHAEKTQEGGDKDPHLSAIGKKRADALAVMLKDAGIRQIFATEFIRTQETAAPLVRLTKASLTILPAKDVAGLATKLRRARGNVLVVGHSNTLGQIAKLLGAKDAPPIAENDYDNLFLLPTGMPSPELLRLHYR